MTNNLTGIILAGGKNSRMGTNKAFLEINGIRIIDRVIAVYKKLFSDIIIVTNSPLSYVEFPDAVIVTDIYKGKGALGGIYTGLFYAKSNRSFVAACDMPFLDEKFIHYLTEQKGNFDVIVPLLSEGYQPLHAIYSRNCLPHIKKMLIADRLKIDRLYKDVKLCCINEEKIKLFDESKHLFLNINTPQDLDEQQS
jgi:molybdopterin-guanine dinucleotide biosynthesis protein A